MRRDLFVFAGQSNMMGAAVYPPKHPLNTARSYEYKHKPRRMGSSAGDFVPAGYPVGEFSYKDLSFAYAPDKVNEQGQSLLNDYAVNTYFCPSMSNLKSEEDRTTFPFSSFSEATAPMGVTLAPFIAGEWEKAGQACAYAHIAKGSVTIDHYFTDDMAREYGERIKQYNSKNGTSLSPDIPGNLRMAGAACYFFEKCTDFFKDAEAAFRNDTLSSRCFFWLQGESDTHISAKEYEIKLGILWDALKRRGFTHFFCLRVDFVGIMPAQERFADKHEDAYIITRAASYFPFAGRDEQDRYCTRPGEEYQLCRDSFFGYPNQHINEKGFLLLAQRATENLVRILLQGEPPVLEEENIRTLCDYKHADKNG